VIVSEAEVIQDHLQRQAQLKLERDLWLPLWQDIAKYVLPRRSFWDEQATPGQKPATKTYDGTAIADLQLLVDGMQGNQVSAAFPWLQLVMEDRRLQGMPGVGDYLEFLVEILLATYARSAFYEAMNEFLMDLGSIGTAVMLVDDDVQNRSILFNTRHIKECFISENRAGEVDVLYRRFRMTNRQIVESWPDKADERRKEWAKTQPFTKGTILHGVFPSKQEAFRVSREPQAAFSSLYIDVDCRKQLEQGDYDGFPYIVGRWRKNSDETYGRSPAADAIDTILRVNQMARMLLQTGQLASDPPLMVPGGMKGKERIVPRGFNYYQNPDEKIYPIDYRQQYPIGLDQENAVREQIHDIFRSKIFILLQQLEHGPYTATEIRHRVAEQAAVLGAIIGRFNKETLVPAVRRTFKILRAQGAMPPPPTALTGMMKIEFMGPLAQSQKRTHQTQGVDAGLEFLERVIKMAPDGMDNVDEDELYRIGLDAVGMPQRIIRELPEVELRRKRRAEALAKQQAAQAQAAQDAQVVDNVKGLNEPVKGGSMLEQLAKQAAQRQGAGRKAPAGAVA